MALLPVVADKVVYDPGTVTGSDPFMSGLRWVTTGPVRASSGLTPAGFSQGLPVDVNGVLCFFDATIGLPSDAQYQNGFIVSSQGLCVSTNPMVTYSNGIPMAANGAVCI